VSLFGSIFPVGAMIGPIFGGLFVTYWSWRGVFFVNVPIGLAIILMALRHIPPDPPRTHDTATRMDAAGMLLLGGGLLAGMLAASYLGEHHATAAPLLFMALLAVAVTCIVLFFRHIRRCTEPFLAPRLVHGRDFGAVNLFNMLVGGITLGSVALVPLYAANRYGLDALSAGTLLIAEGAAAIAMTVASAFALRRTGHRPPLYVGGTVIACGMLMLASRPWNGIPPYAWLAGATLLIGAGYGTTNPASRNAGLQLAPQRSSTIAALRTMCLQVGSIITVSVATAIIASAGAPGSVQSRCYAAAALMVLAAMALIVRRVPEHRGAW
jgi:MFS family permease